MNSVVSQFYAIVKCARANAGANSKPQILGSEVVKGWFCPISQTAPISLSRALDAHQKYLIAARKKAKAVTRREIVAWKLSVLVKTNAYALFHYVPQILEISAVWNLESSTQGRYCWKNVPAYCVLVPVSSSQIALKKLCILKACTFFANFKLLVIRKLDSHACVSIAVSVWTHSSGRTILPQALHYPIGGVQ